MEQAATRKELRQFGLLVGAVFTVIGLWPLIFRGEPLRLWAIGIGGLLIACGGILPQVLWPIHKGWMWVGHILGWINTRILLGIVFYALVTPIGVVFRLIGRDTMRQAFAESNTTYRVVRAPRPHSHMKHQF
jgi:saxitoxin biosynthesis operon SxtJ-like protein